MFSSLTKGITPQICRLCVCVTVNERLCVCVTINERSFEPFLCLEKNSVLSVRKTKTERCFSEKMAGTEDLRCVQIKSMQQPPPPAPPAPHPQQSTTPPPTNKGSNKKQLQQQQQNNNNNNNNNKMLTKRIKTGYGPSHEFRQNNCLRQEHTLTTVIKEKMKKSIDI